MSDVGAEEASGPDPVAGRLDDAAEALGTRRLTVWRRTIYRDRDSDGTGDLGWLWLRAEQRRFPADDHDLLLHYSAADGEWQASTPDGRTARIADTPIRQEAGQAAFAAAVAAFAAGQNEAPGPPGRSASRLPGPEAVRDLPDWVTLILGGITASVVLPFVQAVAGQLADDAYAELRTLMRRVRKSRSEPDQLESAPATGYLRIADPHTGLQLIVPDPMPPEAVRALLAMDQSELSDRTLVWDTVRMEWFACRPE